MPFLIYFFLSYYMSWFGFVLSYFLILTLENFKRWWDLGFSRTLFKDGFRILDSFVCFIHRIFLGFLWEN
jgi:hypothetical protein